MALLAAVQWDSHWAIEADQLDRQERMVKRSKEEAGYSWISLPNFQLQENDIPSNINKLKYVSVAVTPVPRQDEEKWMFT